MCSTDRIVFNCSDLPTKSYVFFKAHREKFCDVTLTVGQRSIAAHRIILSAAIPRFCNIFSEEMLNSQEEVIDFPEVDPNALESLIDFAYTFQIEINTENVKQLLSAASFLQVDQVKNECIRHLLNVIKPDNALSIRNFLCSKLSSSEELQKVDSYIRGNFGEVCHTANFVDIPFDVLKGLIENDDLKVESEEIIFEIVMKWVKHCPEERKHHLPHLLSNVRMSFIKPSYIRNHILKEELVRTSPESRDLIDEALYYYTTPAEREEICNFVAKPRNEARNTDKDVEEISGIYVMYFKMEQMVQILNAEGNAKWQKTNSLDDQKSPYIKLTAAELNKKVYIFFHNCTCVYDLEQNMYSIYEGMSIPRVGTGSVSHNNMLYVVGGIAPGKGKMFEASDVVERFDPTSREWILLRRMNHCRFGPGVAASTEFIYSLGGTDKNHDISNSVERYNIKTGMWMMMPPMLTERLLPGCCTLNHKIYVCGGLCEVEMGFVPCEFSLFKAEVFDPVVNEWKFISSMNTPKVNCKLVPFFDKLYCIGGDDHSSRVDIYETETDKWKRGPPIEKRLPVICAAAV